MKMVNKKEAPVAYSLWALCLVGICGAQRFYLNKPASGLLYLLTFGVFGIGQLADLLFIPYIIDENNRLMGLGAYQKNEVSQSIVINTQDFTAPKIKEDSKEQKILKCCYGEGATLSEIMMTTNIELQDIKNSIDSLLANELLEVSNREIDGKLIYKTV